MGNLATPASVQKLQTALHAKAKTEAEFRFYALYDKIYRDMTWRQVSVVLADHARVRVPKRLSDDGQAHAGLHQGGGVGMPQRVHADRRLDSRRFAGG